MRYKKKKKKLKKSFMAKNYSMRFSHKFQNRNAANCQLKKKKMTVIPTFCGSNVNRDTPSLPLVKGQVILKYIIILVESESSSSLLSQFIQ